MSETESAFPQFGFVGSLPDGTEEAIHSGGMSLRDYFAAKAMQGIIVNWAKVGPGYVPCDLSMGELAVNAYQIADEMIKARGQV